MSVDLAVKLTGNVRLGSLLTETEKVLQEILRLSRRPSVLAESYSPTAPALMPSSVLDGGLGTVRLTMGDCNDDPVFLFVSNRSGDPITGIGGGTFGVVEVHGDSKGLALAAAVALAIARESGSKIEDSMPFFTSEFEDSPDVFLKNIRLNEARDDLRVAAEDFRRFITEKRVRR